MAGGGDKELSLLISSTLNCFGFSKKQVMRRSEFMDEIAKIIQNRPEIPFTTLIVGSAGEGVGLSESDTDVMQIFPDALCVDEGTASENIVILKADYSHTTPGYTKVVPISIPNNLQFSETLRRMSAYETHMNTPIMASEKMKDLYDVLHKVHDASWKLSGPALTLLPGSAGESDNVFSIYFFGGNHLQKWTNRDRNHPWPSKDVINEISNAEGYIVPIGDKQSDAQMIEWRICYTTSEKKLVLNLSDAQMKTYVLLKILAKTILKPKCKFLTSYIVKNVIFWVMEMTDSSQMTPDCIVYLIKYALNFIKHCIQNNHLPNYMIPERNLLKGMVLGKERQNTIKFLEECLEEGGSILLRVPKLYHCISLRMVNQDLVFRFGNWRDKVEQSVMNFERLLCRNIDLRSKYRNVRNSGVNIPKEHINRIPATDLEIIAAQANVLQNVLPDLFPLILSGKSMADIRILANERCKLIGVL
ncbi:uncharacterized protein LOC132734051 [Ruditapes philippinarum]|uniref:uncharacterized protein LOC132734051 n=1 Tax=Ruditapes philippinarum TaxID=129788 RepID=UPI00295AE79A|nr:uncharacterized protein LOC132734051 [Ruditapes philippinarum]